MSNEYIEYLKVLSVRGGDIGLYAQAELIKEEERDSHGRWVSGGHGESPAAQAVAATRPGTHRDNTPIEVAHIFAIKGDKAAKLGDNKTANEMYANARVVLSRVKSVKSTEEAAKALDEAIKYHSTPDSRGSTLIGSDKEIKGRFINDTKRTGTFGRTAAGVYSQDRNKVSDSKFGQYLYSNYGHIRAFNELADALRKDKNVTIEYGLKYDNVARYLLAGEK